MHKITHSDNIIELSGVTFAYDGQKVLDDVTFNVHVGDYMGIIGPNGGGKTTLLKIILHLLQPQAGSVRLFGKDIGEFKDWSKIGYVPQKATNFDVNFPATAEDAVAMGRYGKKGLFRQLGAADRKIIHEAMAQVGIGDLCKKMIGDLSGGQQQRVFIARALASEPEMIILDEPTVGVDEETQEKFYALLKKLNQEMDLTLIIVSHDMDRVRSETSDVVFIDHHLKYHKFLT